MVPHCFQSDAHDATPRQGWHVITHGMLLHANDNTLPEYQHAALSQPTMRAGQACAVAASLNTQGQGVAVAPALQHACPPQARMLPQFTASKSSTAGARGHAAGARGPCSMQI